MGDAAAEQVARPMKFPYTHTAKIAHFPWKYYFNNVWLYKYFGIACILCFPVFDSIRKLSGYLNEK